MTTPDLPPIRPASTAIVLREAGAAGAFEVLMVRRNRSVAFMGGAYVFPGGRVDDGDAVTAAGRRSRRGRAGPGGTVRRPVP